MAPPTVLLQLLLDDEEVEELDARRRRQQQRLTYAMQAVRAVLRDRKRTESRMIRGIQNYVINVVPRYTDTQFKEHFRMDRSTFEVLLQVTQERLTTERTPRIPLHTKVLMALWLLGNQESFRGVADRFGVNKGLLHYIVNNIIELWAGAAPDFIQWPLSLQDVAHEFYRKWRFPGVVGAVDGCHIAIKAPEKEQDAYYNRKEFHSIILQGCCDSNMAFTHVHAGSPGRMHDAKVFSASGLDRLVEKLPANFHILGDSAYALSVGLMRPYRNNGHLSAQEIKFNERLGAARSVIERAFAQLKGKFRRLKYLDMKGSALISKYVLASCVLHNIILMSKDSFDCESLEEEGDDDDPSFDGNSTGVSESRGALKRRAVMLAL
ncbi:putative nuclease HARBI1 isoform X2 [Dermacentor andersoni]|uniref:putative nuclease HARBI1 isoform X2 n=1 Tax=Dermacentor andersoni TaxID=34620 RepID=UPI003B3B8773